MLAAEESFFRSLIVLAVAATAASDDNAMREKWGKVKALNLRSYLYSFLSTPRRLLSMLSV